MGEEETRTWTIKLDGDDVVVNEISGQNDTSCFLGVECKDIVGIIKNGLKWTVVESSHPKSEPWYMMKAVACYPNMFIYNGKDEARWINPADDVKLIGAILKFNKEQLDKAVKEFVND